MGIPKLLIRKSGRRGSNPRRPAWEAGILPLNYSRLRKQILTVSVHVINRFVKNVPNSGQLPSQLFSRTLRFVHCLHTDELRIHVCVSHRIGDVFRRSGRTRRRGVSVESPRGSRPASAPQDQNCFRCDSPVEEPGALEEGAMIARAWFDEQLAKTKTDIA